MESWSTGVRRIENRFISKHRFCDLQGGTRYLGPSEAEPHMKNNAILQAHLAVLNDGADERDGGGAARSKDAQGKPTQGHMSPKLPYINMNIHIYMYK